MTTFDPEQHDGADALLAALREAESDVGPPPRVAAALLAAWDVSHRTAGDARRRGLRNLLALAAGATLVASLVRLGGGLREALPAETGVRTALTGTETAARERFVLVGEPIIGGEMIRVVRMQMPAASLSALGLRARSGDLADVDVELLIGEDGVARAIRLGR